jgi:hypothetical protein
MMGKWMFVVSVTNNKAAKKDIKCSETDIASMWSKYV